jgi:hypothetical protein
VDNAPLAPGSSPVVRADVIHARPRVLAHPKGTLWICVDRAFPPPSESRPEFGGLTSAHIMHGIDIVDAHW